MASVATPLRAPRTEADAAERLAALLHASCEAVAERWRVASALPDTGEAAALSVLERAIADGLRGAPTPPLAPYDWAGDAPRLLTEIRRAVLTDAPRHAIPPGDVLRIVEQIERLLRVIEAEVTAHFPSHMLGQSALQLLVDVAHDMRSPLGSIQFLVERMRAGQSGPVSALQERHLGLVYSAAFGLSALASDLMEVGHGSAQLVGLQAVPFSVVDVLHAVRDVVQPISEEKQLGIRVSGPSTDIRMGHPAALHRVLLNLVTNALKFTAAGYVTVETETVSDDVLRFTVRDSGRGMPASVIAYFDGSAAQRREAGDVRAFSSAGLGLSISQRLVAAMGGVLTIASSDASGTRLAFELNLPVTVTGSGDARQTPDGRG